MSTPEMVKISTNSIGDHRLDVHEQLKSYAENLGMLKICVRCVTHLITIEYFSLNIKNCLRRKDEKLLHPDNTRIHY